MGAGHWTISCVDFLVCGIGEDSWLISPGPSWDRGPWTIFWRSPRVFLSWGVACSMDFSQRWSPRPVSGVSFWWIHVQRTEEEVDNSREGFGTVVCAKQWVSSSLTLESQDNPCLLSPKGRHLWLLLNTSLPRANARWMLFHNTNSTSICAEMHDKFHLGPRLRVIFKWGKSEYKGFTCSLRKKNFFVSSNHQLCCRKEMDLRPTFF